MRKTRHKKILLSLILSLCFCLAAGTGLFLYNAHHSYNINSGFHPLPLDFHPDDASSTYIWNGARVTVYGGFIKGIQSAKGGDFLVIRALSPLPVVEVKAQNAPVSGLLMTVENISPEYYASKIAEALRPVRIAINALEFNLSLQPGEIKEIRPEQPGNTEDDNYVILGDSRDGYETFEQIINQVNALHPVFIIDNGDLVFGGKPNQYRLFDQMVSGISSTLCTTLGNHDIRMDGRETYQKLYGPNYYSFDFGSNHFVFLDSSQGGTETPAISDEQYAWLESDLTRAQGKQIYVISHVPPIDPRSGIKPNDIQAYTDKVEKEGGFIEQKLEAYSDKESLDHGFLDKQESAKFENLMTKYKVRTVYLSHIHSYFDFTKNGVRYIISGGAGAELLTQNSYYHYLVAKAGPSDTLTMVQLPSPANLLLQRYGATVSLFASAMFHENHAAVSFFIAGLILLALFLLVLLYIRVIHRKSRLWILTKDTGKFIAVRFKEIYKK